MNNISASFYDPLDTNVDYPAYFRQTKNSKGKFLNVQYSLNNLSAEWQIINTWVNNIDEIIGKKIIYLQQEPPECKKPNSKLLDNVKCVITPFKFKHIVKQYISHAPLQWNYDLNINFIKNKGHNIQLANKIDLGRMLNKEKPLKYKICSFIVSAKSFLPGHKKRLNFLNKIVNHFKNKIDYYGFGFNEIKNKKEAIDPYMFSIAIENTSLHNFWTEKIADVYLGHTCPIYYGCKNISNFFEKDSLINIDIDNLDKTIHDIESILDNPEKFLPSKEKINRERLKILNQYNFFNIITGVINIENNKKTLI